MGNAERFVRQHGNVVRYSFSHPCWYVYDGQRWNRDDQGEVKELAKLVVLSMYKEVADCLDGNRRQLLAGHARNSEYKSRLDAMVSLAKTDKRVIVRPEALDADPMLLNLANGTVDLKAGTLLPHDARHLLTKLTDISYDPEAICPRWELFLDEVTDGDKDLARYLAQVVGYFLTGSTKEQAFFMMLGAGANGKSVFLSVVKKLLGEYGATTDFNTFLERKNEGPRSDLARLQGARMALCSETGVGKRLDETVVKQVTGGDRISARFLYGNDFEFDPQFKIVLATNHLPLILGTENGMWRRVHVIPFNVTFTEDRQDKDLVEKLYKELPGILNWALEGCLSWQKDGLAVPLCVEEARKAYREEMDSVHAFVVSECVVEPGVSVPASHLYARYQAWCEEGGQTAVSQTLFGRRLNERGIVADKGGRSNLTTRKGITLKTEVEKAPSVTVSAPAAVALPTSGSSVAPKHAESGPIQDDPDLLRWFGYVDEPLMESSPTEAVVV